MAFDTGLVFSADRAKPHTMSRSDIAETCTVAGWVHNNAEAVCIAMAESSGKTDAVSVNPDGNQNIGLFQIDTVNVVHSEYLKDPVYNANVAYRMWRADGGTFSKHWATASQCAGKTGNEPLASEATPDNPVANLGSTIGNAIAGSLAALLNSIPWFRVGKGALGFILVIVGVGSLVVVTANKVPTPARAVKRAIA